MTAPKPTRLNGEACLRIMKAVGRWPAIYTGSDFERDLSKAVYDYVRYHDLRDIKSQQDRLQKIRKHASALATLLATDEEEGVLDWYSHWPKDLPLPSKAAQEIQRMVEESDILRKSSQKLINEIKDDNAVLGSAFEWLVGTRLPEIFEKFFSAAPTLYQKGEFVRFALQTLAEFQISNRGRSYSTATIIKALTDAQSGRRRRKGRNRGQK
jgi:hypothetical protein